MPAITCTSPVSTFSPSQTSPIMSPKDSSPTLPLPITAPKTLIVDDNSITARVLSKILQKEFGHQTTCAESGKDALVQLSHEVFDLIFMDIDMPELSGIETAQAIHSSASVVLEQNKRIPIIAYTTNQCEKRYFEAGMQGWIGKPTNHAMVRTELERVYTANASPKSPTTTSSLETR